MQPECISQRASSGRLNCSCSRSRDLTAINPVVPEMMKIAALAVSTAPGGNMSFAFSKSVPIAPAKGRGKRTPAWTNRRAKALVPCGFADAKTAKGILQYQNSRKRLSNCPRIPREEVRKYGSFQSGAKYGIYRYEQPPLAKQGIVLKGKGLVVANAFAARRLGLYPCGLIPYQPGEDRRNPRSGITRRQAALRTDHPQRGNRFEALRGMRQHVCGGQQPGEILSRLRGKDTPQAESGKREKQAFTDKNNYIASTANEYPFARNARASHRERGHFACWDSPKPLYDRERT